MNQHRLFSYRPITTVLAVAALSACAESAAAPGATTPPVSFSVSTAEAIGSSQNRASFATVDAPLVIVSGKDTLSIDSVRVVLAQVTLARLADEACGTTGHDDANDASCSNLSTGPTIVKLPLTAGALSLFDIPVPAGTYTKFSVRVHKPSSGDVGPNAASFLAANPTWTNISIRVDGTFDGVPVHWSHDPVVQLSHEFTPPLVISAASNFTLKIDIASWFKATTGALIDPNAKTNALYPQIASNVNKSFTVFKDDTKKGHDDGK